MRVILKAQVVTPKPKREYLVKPPDYVSLLDKLVLSQPSLVTMVLTIVIIMCLPFFIFYNCECVLLNNLVEFHLFLSYRNGIILHVLFGHLLFAQFFSKTDLHVWLCHFLVLHQLWEYAVFYFYTHIVGLFLFWGYCKYCSDWYFYVYGNNWEQLFFVKYTHTNQDLPITALKKDFKLIS